MEQQWRTAIQPVMPGYKSEIEKGGYDIYPAFHLEDAKITDSIELLVNQIKDCPYIRIDGYIGVFYGHLKELLDSAFNQIGKDVAWFFTEEYMKSENQIGEMVTPFIGGEDPVFGSQATLELEDFFDEDAFNTLKLGAGHDVYIMIGPGAALAKWSGPILYADMPKNEIQFRSRAGAITNLGVAEPADSKTMYKRFYFVDWPVLNRHKRHILPRIDYMIDAQRPDHLTWMDGTDLHHALYLMSRNVFRARPAFEPGAWGGTWMKDHIQSLNQHAVNFAWSFEMIAPENGLILESSGLMLEVSFDSIMFQEGEAILGEHFGTYGTEFPIRFDFLDTFDGGNLSIQCHPHYNYIKDHFGENISQQESYYILDRKDDAVVYLGFQDGAESEDFQQTLKESFQQKQEINISRYVQAHPSNKHDLFLIPPGTIHGSGKNNLVLEISTTPYIFTFKMYDWLRVDLDGKPRPLNIQRGMDNLRFERQGERVKQELLTSPEKIDEGRDWQLFHLPTHPAHLYDVHRYHINSYVDINTDGKFHVLNLVEGESIIIETQQGMQKRFNYAETFVIPAAAESYRIINDSYKEIKIVTAFMK